MTTETMTPAKQRIDGDLHRALPASLTIREAEAGQPDEGLMRLRLSVSSEAPYTRASFFDEPWIEVLGHRADEIDFSRLNGGAPVMANHKNGKPIGKTPLASIGMVERAWLEGGRMVADLVISRRDDLADLRQDIADKLVRNVSIGYAIQERVLTRKHDNGLNEYRVTKWSPFEISLVDVPADASVGLGRAADEQRSSNYRIIDLPAEGNTTGAASMDANTTTAGDNTTAATQPTEATLAQQTRAHVETGPDPVQRERKRAHEIRALGAHLNMSDIANDAIDSGMSVDNFRALVLSKMTERGEVRPAESPDIGLSEREIKQFSFCRALLAASDPVNAAKLAPFEMECSRAAQDKRGDSRDKTRETAVTVPVDVFSRGLVIGDAASASAAQMLIGNARRSAQSYQHYRDLLVGTPASGGNLVATELLGTSFIELLRNAMVLSHMGITWLRDLNGNIAIPRQNGAAQTYWIPENGEPTESSQSIDQVTMSPKTTGAFTDYSRRLLLQSSIDVEAFVRADLAAIIGLAIQLAALNGSGQNNVPLGLLNITGIGSVEGGTDGGAPTYEHVVDLETAVSNANADVGTLAYLTNSRVRGKLRKTQEFNSTNGKPVWTRGGERGVGDVLGYNAFVTNAVPHDLVKGSASNCSAIMFGNWSDMLIGMWGGLDLMLDQYAHATSGGKRIIALQDVDIAFRHVESFAVMKDALTI